MLMNGKEVNHLVINGEAFDKSYENKKVEIINKIFMDSKIGLNGTYQEATFGGILPKGTKGYVTALKYHDLYYICQANGDPVGTWARSSDIKILD